MCVCLYKHVHIVFKYILICEYICVCICVCLYKHVHIVFKYKLICEYMCVCTYMWMSV